MGIGRFFRSLVNPEVMGEEIVATQEKAYRKAETLYPGADPHILLAQVWLSRMAAHGKNPMDELMQTAAYSETLQFACIPPPKNVRALGLYFIYKEQPSILESNQKFGLEFKQLMQPVLTAIENGTIEDLYQRYNPQMES
jgi:hypothetical protein